MADSPVKEGQVLAGKYRVERVLGSGGMGVVVAAWHLELEQRVAVKFLHPLALERADTAERFRREARSAAKIRSEHVARVIDVGIMEGGIPYMVMEYLEGHDLSDEMSKVGMLPIEDAVDFILQAIEALAEAHAAGIVHRDLKPANLFIASRPDGTRIVKVLDFGISKSLLGGSSSELSLTRTSVLIGSPLYMSPEQMRSAKDVDTRTDIWSLGVILYEMLTGRPPYTGDSIPALCASLLNDVPQSMRALRADVPAELEDVIRHCMAKDRAERYATVSELARALAQFGSVASQLHVDRASRVLGVTEVSVLSDSSDRRLSRSADASGRARAVSVPRTTPVPSTQDSWGRTDSPITGDATAKPKSRGPLFAVVGLGAAAVVIAVLFLRNHSPSTPPAASASVAGPTPPAQVPAPLGETRAPVAPEPVAPVVPEPVVVPSSVAPDPAAPVVRPQESAAKPKPIIQAPAAFFKPKPAASSPPKAASSNELSDFGGRR
ncbi:MAG TPA: protein kinase [Polyangiaceae bacterium]|nr:protein kinase [Polyangiaceae bacterium]